MWSKIKYNISLKTINLETKRNKHEFTEHNKSKVWKLQTLKQLFSIIREQLFFFDFEL